MDKLEDKEPKDSKKKNENGDIEDGEADDQETGADGAGKKKKKKSKSRFDPNSQRKKTNMPAKERIALSYCLTIDQNTSKVGHRTTLLSLI